MRRRAIVLTLVGTASTAAADSNDLVMARLGTRITDGSGNVTSVIGQPVEFRSLASQLGVVLAPAVLTPADSLGFSGFQLSVDYSGTTIDRNASYWRALEGAAPSMMSTVGFFVRKGVWFPVPSFEAGAGAVDLVDSHVWAAQLYGKVALHEGYHDLPLPSFAVRGAVSRMIQQRELDLTVASVDLEISKHVGVGGTWRFDPFAGWNVLMIIPHSQVIDPTPNIDPLTPGNDADGLLNFVFADQDTIIRQRLFVGAKLQYYVFQLTIEGQLALAGTSIDEPAGASAPCMLMSTTTACDAKDTAKSQRTLSMSAGFVF